MWRFIQERKEEASSVLSVSSSDSLSTVAEGVARTVEAKSMAQPVWV